MDERSHASTRLLVVDDDGDLREFLRDLLVEEGYAVDVAASLDEALTLVDDRLYHLILTDLLAHSSATPLRSALAIHKHAFPTPVMALTGWNITAAEVTRAGLARLIAKPFDLTDLLSTVSASIKTPLSAEQQHQAERVRHFFNAINASDLNALMATCGSGVRLSIPSKSFGEPAAPIVGQAAVRAYFEQHLRSKADMRVDEYLIYPRSDGLALRYRMEWLDRETPNARATATAGLIIQFSGDRIQQLALQTPETSLEAIPPQTTARPSAHERQD